MGSLQLELANKGDEELVKKEFERGETRVEKTTGMGGGGGKTEDAKNGGSKERFK